METWTGSDGGGPVGWVSDLILVAVGSVLVAGAVLLPGLSETPLRIVVGVPFVLLAPGYALVSALYPARGTITSEREGDGIERMALALGTSFALVPLTAIALDLTPFGIHVVPLTIALVAETLLVAAVAVVRRLRLPETDRFRPPFGRWAVKLRATLGSPDGFADALFSLLVVLSVLLAVASVGYAVAVPRQEQPYTAVALLTETEDGGFVTADYPSEFVVGEPRSLYVSVENQEQEPVTYTLVVQLQRIDAGTDGVVVRERTELSRTDIRVADGETVRHRSQVTPEWTGTDLRLAYLLYRDGAPSNPTTDGAYRSLTLRVNVTAA